MEDGYPEGHVKLHLGSGRHNWGGWINIDLDARADIQRDIKSLSFPDNYADVAISVHVLEHFYEWEVQSVLQEWARVLKPGGKLILELPCMDKVFNHIAQSWLSKKPMSPMFSLFALWGDPKYKSVQMCHKWGYTYGMLKDLLSRSGYVNIQSEKARYHFPDRDMRVVSYKPSTT